MLAWYGKFPEYQANELFLSDESYADIYVPYLAYYIDQYNTVIRKIYSDYLRDAILLNQCDFSSTELQNTTQVCMDLLNEFETLVADVNVYNIFEPVTYHTPTLRCTTRPLKLTKYSLLKITPFLQRGEKPLGEHRLSMLPPCTFGNPILDYLNRADVKTALWSPDLTWATLVTQMALNKSTRLSLAATRCFTTRAISTAQFQPLVLRTGSTESYNGGTFTFATIHEAGHKTQ